MLLPIQAHHDKNSQEVSADQIFIPDSNIPPEQLQLLGDEDDVLAVIE